MNILAIDTCLDACSVAAAIGDGARLATIAGRFEPMRMGQAERLLPMIEDVLADLSLAMPEIDRIACTHGPGTFTGTRITVAAARALSLATGAKIVSVSSLELMAHSARLGGLGEAQRVLIATDAHRDEVYAQAFEGPARTALTEPARLSLKDAAALCDTLVIGHIAGSGAGLIAGAGLANRRIELIATDLLPDARDLLAIAPMRTPLAEPLNPLYLRPPDAKPQTGKSITRAM